MKAEDAKDLGDDEVLYSIRGKAPEGYYHAGTERHASKGSGYEDHQIFKKLPTQAAPEPEETPEAPIEEVAEEVPEFVPESKNMSDAKSRAKAGQDSQGQTDLGIYNEGPTSGNIYSERSRSQPKNYDFSAKTFQDNSPCKIETLVSLLVMERRIITATTMVVTYSI